MDFKKLYAIASRLRESDDEKVAFFPYLEDKDLTIGDDVWSLPHSQPAQHQETMHHNPRLHDVWERDEPQLSKELDREGSPAHTPNEECPPSSANTSAAAGTVQLCFPHGLHVYCSLRLWDVVGKWSCCE